MAEPLLDVQQLRKVFPLRGGMLRRRVGSISAVDDVSFSLAAGETVGLVGESGCGKSTLAKLVVGLLSPTQGAVRLRGSVQLIFQDPTNSLNPRMTVEEIVSEPLISHRLASRRERRRRVIELLEAVQLPASYLSRVPRELSGGERQRVGIARALATNPQLLICDEPIASLDVSVGAKILELLKRLVQQRRMALLFISHDLRAVAFLCGRIAVMRQGRLLEEAPTDTLLNQPRDPYTELLIRSADLDLDAPDFQSIVDSP
jgi:ABC-type glutathione transport system ATPase component